MIRYWSAFCPTCWLRTIVRRLDRPRCTLCQMLVYVPLPLNDPTAVASQVMAIYVA